MAAVKRALRLPGTAAVFTAATTGVPLALTHHIKHNRVLHERVLLISGAGRMSAAAARAAGASGFVSKDWEASEIARAVRMVGLGMTMFAPKADQPTPLLTERERRQMREIPVAQRHGVGEPLSRTAFL